MNRNLQLAGCAVGLLLATACSSGGSTAVGYPKSATPATGTTAATTTAPAVDGTEPVGVASAPNSLGPILTDTKGRSLYLFEADKGPTSTCTGGCAREWPPLIALGAPMAGADVNGALLSTHPRPDGAMQVTYNGHPLYYYDDDHGPGTTAGQGNDSFGANWYLLTPAGVKIDTD